MRFLRNKKGSAIIENIMLLPIIIYAILFTTFKVVSWASLSNMYRDSSVSARQIAVQTTLENGLDQLAYNVANEENGFNKYVSITKITITNSKNKSEKVEVVFDVEGKGNKTFRTYIGTNNNIPYFNYESWHSTKKDQLASLWTQGNIIEIELTKNLAQQFDYFLSYKIYDVSKGEYVDMTFGIDTILKVDSSYVIST